jgi:hypothetical protein
MPKIKCEKAVKVTQEKEDVVINEELLMDFVKTFLTYDLLMCKVKEEVVEEALKRINFSEVKNKKDKFLSDIQDKSDSLVVDYNRYEYMNKYYNSDGFFLPDDDDNEGWDEIYQEEMSKIDEQMHNRDDYENDYDDETFEEKIEIYDKNKEAKYYDEFYKSIEELFYYYYLYFELIYTYSKRTKLYYGSNSTEVWFDKEVIKLDDVYNGLTVDDYLDESKPKSKRSFVAGAFSDKVNNPEELTINTAKKLAANHLLVLEIDKDSIEKRLSKYTKTPTPEELEQEIWNFKSLSDNFAYEYKNSVDSNFIENYNDSFWPKHNRVVKTKKRHLKKPLINKQTYEYIDDSIFSNDIPDFDMFFPIDGNITEPTKTEQKNKDSNLKDG